MRYETIAASGKKGACFDGFSDNRGKWKTGTINGNFMLVIKDGHYAMAALGDSRLLFPG